MFDTRSDYSLNKNDPDAIVCRSSDGVHIRLTREDFDSEEEFLRWKNWSDDDYYTTENDKRSYYDNCLALNEDVDVPLSSAEEEMLAPMLRAESDERRAALLETVRSSLTKKQYRRLRMYYLEGMTEAEISLQEGVCQQRISNSLVSGKKILERFFQEFLRSRGKTGFFMCLVKDTCFAVFLPQV